MRQYLFPLLFFILCVGTPQYGQKKENSKGGLKPLDSLVKNHKKAAGLITTYLSKDEKLFFEIEDALLNKDLLVVTRIAQLPADYSPYINAGSKTAEQVIRFTKKGSKIYFEQVSFNNIANETDPIRLSVEENNFRPILAAFKIKNKETDSYLIDVTAHFMKDAPGFNIIRKSVKDNYKIGAVDKNRSRIDRAKSFPENTEILHTLTFSASKAPRSNRAKTFSFQINHSFIALPEDPMPIRLEDERVGWFSLNKTNYSSEALKADTYSIVRRWRLEPKDKAAYAKGELVEPIKPIVYYLDPATPMKWRPYFKQGIEDWNTAFEKAGFKNAILAKDPPSKEEDPNFSPEDVRYSTVRYVASKTRNAVGPSVSDPRTGEILESDIIWYHNHLRSYRNRYLLETGAANPKARTLYTPEAEIGEMMRRVISHEIGHALGLPHNMKASSAYPVDSLRSGSFTQKMGIATTIMDYARYNYIAQPGDENIRFVRQLGPYDDYAIEWGYRYYPGLTIDEETAQLKNFVDEKSLDPMYMFGGRGNDPDAQTENIGDDPIKASNYGLKNLKIVAKNLPDWVLEKGKGFDDLNELYGELLGVYRRYIYHVIQMVGGVNKTLHHSHQTEAITYKNLNAKAQTDALAFLNTQLWTTPSWLMDKKIVSEIKGEGGLMRIQNLQRSALERMLSVKRLNRMLSTSKTIGGVALSVNDLTRTLVKNLVQDPKTPDESQRHLQVRLVEHLQQLMTDEKLNPVIKTVLMNEISKIHSTAKRKSRTAKDELKAHYHYLEHLSKAK